jgi:hypothetical protein
MQLCYGMLFIDGLENGIDEREDPAARFAIYLSFLRILCQHLRPAQTIAYPHPA